MKLIRTEEVTVHCRLLPGDSARPLTQREHCMGELVLSHDRSTKQKRGQGSGCRLLRENCMWAEAVGVLEPVHKTYSSVTYNVPRVGAQSE